MDNHKISWENVKEIDDCIITYLLYREGKGIEVISRIRNISIEKVEKDIIDAKIKVRTLSLKRNKKSLLDRMLEYSKNERLEFIKKQPPEDVEELVLEIKGKYRDIKNPEDKASLIWLIGELKDERLLSLLTRDILHHNGNVRRMICSALGKIGKESAVPILHKALYDNKPQVRQYAAKALKTIGNDSSLELLNQLLKNGNEKDYVKRAFKEAVESIKLKKTP